MQSRRPSILDLEASGFGAASYPIEVGIALGDGRKYCSLIRPGPDWTHWDTDAEGVHGISRSLLAQHGRSPREVAEQLNLLAAGLTLYSDGWVVDSPWLTTLFYAAGVEALFRLSPLETILDELQMARWHTVKDAVLADCTERRHRASFDAYVVQETWCRTRAGL
jgi:hypothetical protein